MWVQGGRSIVDGGHDGRSMVDGVVVEGGDPEERRDVKEEEKKRERNGGEGVFIPPPWLKDLGKLRWVTTFDPKGRSEGKPAERLAPSNLRRFTFR